MSSTDRLALPFENGLIEVPEEGEIVVFRALLGSAYELLPRDRLTCLQPFFPAARTLAEAGYTCAAAAPGTSRLAIVHLTRSRDENRANIALAHQSLISGGTLVVDGAKTDGVESLLKTTKKLMPVDGQLSKSHGKVFWLTKSTTPDDLQGWAAELQPRQNPDGYWTMAGVFSADGIDKGSAELEPLLKGKLRGRGADLGAGWGYLSEQALAANPEIEALELFEADNNAVECAAKNLTDPRASVQWQDVTALSAKSQYDFIIMNPPFHQSRKADPAIGQQFIQTAARLLKPAGKLYMVANRQLAYEATLDACFSKWEQLSQSGQYKCILARKPKR